MNQLTSLPKYLSLASKNLRRRLVRTSLTVAGVGLAVAVAVSLGGFMLGYRTSIDRSIDMLGFQVMIMAKGCPYEAATMMLKGGTGLLYLPSDTYDKVRKDPDVESITPIFVGVGQKEGSGVRDEGSEAAFTVMSGVEASSFLVMKPWLKMKEGRGYDGGRWFDAKSETEIVLGYEAAEYEQRKVGDTFYATVMPAGKATAVQREFRIVGVLERTGTQDDGTIFLPITAAQKLFNRPNELTILGIKLKDFSSFKLRDFENRWLKLPEVQVVGLQQVKSTLIGLVATAQAMVAAVAVVAVIVALLGVVNSVLMSVYERTGEIGVMKALGARRGDIFQLIWLETLMVCLAGSLLGSAGAAVGSSLVEKALRSLIDLGVSGSIVLITPRLIAGSVAGSVVLGFFAGLYPAWRASSMRPVDAIREGGA